MLHMLAHMSEHQCRSYLSVLLGMMSYHCGPTSEVKIPFAGPETEILSNTYKTNSLHYGLEIRTEPL
jgi:hypothetical protein